MKMSIDPVSKLVLPEQFIEAKHSLKRSLNKIVEDAINSVNFSDPYFLVLHAKFDKEDPSTFVVSQLKACLKIPPFTSNQMVFWVCPKQGIRELLWMVPAKKPGEKLKVEFNTEGVAYLKAKGAMSS